MADKELELKASEKVKVVLSTEEIITIYTWMVENKSRLMQLKPGGSELVNLIKTELGINIGKYSRSIDQLKQKAGVTYKNDFPGNKELTKRVTDLEDMVLRLSEEQQKILLRVSELERAAVNASKTGTAFRNDAPKLNVVNK